MSDELRLVDRDGEDCAFGVAIAERSIEEWDSRHHWHAPHRIESAWREPQAPYGFEWGPMTVTRLAHIEGRGYALEVRTTHTRLEIHVTKAGRRITVVEATPGIDTEGRA